ncbi:MAG: LuxR C-terminal-related transcriptional regulator, partial [Chloroflexota bacterium]|nr:LuxR C-terminal-related transcriptional regulator [Chloroflexota bacterium]
RLMHVPLDSGIQLIQGQFISLGAYIYNQSQSFRTTQEEQRSQMEAQERARCESVKNEATSAQRKVLRAFSKGLTPKQVASHLIVSTATIDSHKSALLRLCRNAWNVPDDEHLDYHFLYRKFAPYFENDE